MKIASLEFDLLANIARLQQDMRRAEGVVERSMRQIETQVQRVQRAFGALGIGLGLGATVRQVQQLADAWQGMENRLRLVTTSQRQLEQATNDVFRISQRTSSGMDSVAQVYQRFAQNAGSLGLNLSDVAKLSETVSKAVAVSGSTAAAADAALMQFGQALASGVLRGEEFNSIMEQTPALMQAIADGMGVPLGAMRALAAEGKITGDVIVAALTKARESVDEKFETRVKTIAQAWTEVNNALTRYVGQASQAGGLSSFYVSGLGLLADNLDLVAKAFMGLAIVAIPAATRALWAFTTVLLANPFARIAAAILVVIELLSPLVDRLREIERQTQAFGKIFSGAWADIKQAIYQAGSQLTVFHTDANKLARDQTMSSWANSLLIGFGYLADSVVFVAKAIATTASGINMLIASGQQMLAFFARPGIVTEWLNPEEAARLEGEYQKVAQTSMAALEQFKSSFSDLMSFEGKWGKFAAEVVQNLRLVGETIEEVDLTGKPPTLLPDTGKVNSAYQTLISTLRSKIEQNKLEIATEHKASEADKQRIKVMQDLAAGRLKLTGAQKQQVESLLTLLKTSEQELTISQMVHASKRDGIDLTVQAVQAAYEETTRNELLAKTFGMTSVQVERLTMARLQDRLAQAETLKLTAEEIKALELLIAAKQRNIAALSTLGAREQQKAAWEQWARDVEQIFQQVGQSLTDALFEGGKSARDMIKDLFKTLTLRVLVQPMMSGLQGWVTNAVGPMLGYKNPSSGGLGGAFGTVSNISSLWSMFSGGLTSTVGSGIASLGSMLGSSALQSFAAGMQGSTLAAGLAGPTTAGASGAMGLGAAAGAALPWVAGGLAAYSLISSFMNAPEARYGGTYQHIPGIGTIRPGWERGDPGPQAMQFADNLLATASDAIQRAFSGVGSNALLTALEASFESSGKGRGGTHSGGVLVIDGHEIRFGTSAKGQGHGGTSGTLEEMMRNAEIDTWQTVIQAWQAAIDEFPSVMQDMIRNVDADSLGLEAAQQLAQQFIQVIEQTNAFTEALRNLPFVPATAATFEYAAALAQSVGGVEEATRLLNSYYQNYYTEAERAAALTEQLTREFAALGFELPRTRDELRGLIEAQMALGEAGIQTLSVLLRLESAFASLVPAGEAASAAFEAQLQVVRDVASELGRLSSLRTRVGTLLDRINRNTAFGDMREQELWAAMATASYEQQIELASELTDIVLSRYETEIAAVERLRDLGRGLRDYLESLATSELAPVDLATKVAEAERQLQEAVAKARAGDEDALSQIQGLTQNALELWRRYGASGDAYQDAYYRITGMVGDLADQAMSDAERQLSVSQDTLAQLEQLRGVAETAYNAIDAQYQAMQLSLQNETLVLTELGIQSGQLHTIADLLRSMPAGLAAALQPMLDAATQSVIGDWYAGTGITPDQSAMDYWTRQLSSRPQSVVQDDFYRTLVDNWYKDHLGWSGDIAGIEYWAEQAKLLGPEQAFINFARTAGIPGYWMGGYASGLSLVGERGPELVDFTTPGRVYSNDVLAKVMRGGPDNELSNAEVKALVEKVLRAIEVADRNNVAGHSANVNATNQSADKIADATERGVHAAALAR